MAQDVVLRAVRKLAGLNMHGNTATNNQGYLPKLAKAYRLLDDVAERKFAEAMRELIKDGRLVIAEIGKHSNRSPKMGIREP